MVLELIREYNEIFIRSSFKFADGWEEIITAITITAYLHIDLPGQWRSEDAEGALSQL